MAGDPAKLDSAAAHRHFAVECFNRAWGLIEKAERTADEDEQMVLLALASLWHWTERADCTDENRSIGHWQASRAYALVGNAAEARRHGERSLATAAGLPPFYAAYAHEALARAALVGGDGATAARHLAEARRLGEAVTDAEEKKLLDADLATLVSRPDPTSP